MRLAIFKDVNRAPKIVFEQLARTCFAVHSREHAGIRGGVDHEISGGQRFKIRGAADIRVDDFYAERGEFTPVQFAARTDEIIRADNLQAFHRRQQRMGQGAANESADTGDENFHARLTGSDSLMKLP